MRRFGPKCQDYPSIGKECPACQKPFVEGDYTALIAYGPGNDPEERQKALEGKPYNAICAEVHWHCAGGA